MALTSLLIKAPGELRKPGSSEIFKRVIFNYSADRPTVVRPRPVPAPSPTRPRPVPGPVRSTSGPIPGRSPYIVIKPTHHTPHTHTPYITQHTQPTHDTPYRPGKACRHQSALNGGSGGGNGGGSGGGDEREGDGSGMVRDGERQKSSTNEIRASAAVCIRWRFFTFEGRAAAARPGPGRRER